MFEHPSHIRMIGTDVSIPSSRSGVLRFLGAAIVFASLLAAGDLAAQGRVGGGAPQGGPGGPPAGVPGGPGGGGFGGFGQPRIEIADEFDVDGDGVLDAEERARAREALAQRNGGRGGGFGGFGGGRGGGRGGGGGGFAPASQGARVTPDQVASYAGRDLYDTGIVRTIFIEFEGLENWEEELAAFYNTDVQIPATAIVDGVTYENVGVRFRGNSSFSMVPAGSKRPIRLKFDFVDGDQNLEGYRTLNLLNAMNDPTFTRSVLFSEIARKYIPAPKVGYVRLVINGENWGLYVHQQQYNNDLVEDFFGERAGVRWQVPGTPNGQGGMVYLGDDPDLYRTIYEIDNRDNATSWNALINLFRVLNETPLDGLEAALEPILDVDGALRFLALDVALANSDGFWTRASDYNIYLGTDGRFRIFPHDMNEAMGAGGGGPGGGGGGGRGGIPGGPGVQGVPGGPGAPPAPGGIPGGPGGFPGGGGGGVGNVNLDPLVGMNDAAKPLRSRLLSVPALRERYLGYVRQIAEEDLDWAVLGPRLAQLRNVVEAEVARDTRKLYTMEAFETGFETAANSLKAFADARRAYLLSATVEVAR